MALGPGGIGGRECVRMGMGIGLGAVGGVEGNGEGVSGLGGG